MTSYSILSLLILVSIANAKSIDKDRKIEETIRKGIVDPLYVGNYTVLPGNGVLRVTQKIYNMLVRGLSKAEVTIKSDLKGGKVGFSYKANRIYVHLDYELDGRCLIMPIWGKGTGIITMDDVRVSVNADVDGQQNVHNLKVTFELGDANFNLSSLLGENPGGLLTFLYTSSFNANAKYIFNEILPSYLPQSEDFFLSLWKPLVKNA
ncbi:hypothetical protein WA026_000411 [Henosepilachna vigintioctopunctata]|uniref:Uncharacterized protein n=1 Tax=Henosepilachna vigintioctopunctata TaxID=420089 RepID=A0AAW1V529_9CUCU